MAEKKTLKFAVPAPNLWMLVSAVLALALVLALSGVIPTITGKFYASESVERVLSASDAGNKAIEYINNNLVRTGQASLVGVEEANGMYKVTTTYQGRNIDVYITKDGRWLFVSQPFDTSKPVQSAQTTTTTQPQGLPKSDRPEVHAFVMSHCPFGLQFIKAYVPVMELLGDKADLELNFVHYIMHGEKEVKDNTRMYCIQKEQRDKFTDYLRCFVEDGDAEKCIEEAGVDKASLDACIERADEEFEITKNFEESGERFPPYKVDAELASRYGVRGSPTFVVNGKIMRVNRSPEAIKEAICSAFNDPPEECDQELSTTTEQPGFGAMGSGSGASSGGQC